MPRKISRSVESNLPLHKGEDFTGRMIGEWTVVGFHSYTPTKKGGYYKWICRCSCGITKILMTNTLLYGTTSRCLTCANNKGSGENNPNWKGYGAISGTILQKIKMGAIKRRSKSRDLDVDIDCEYLNSLWEKQGGLCAYSKRPLILQKTASVDRIDSSKGYITGNVHWVDVDVNRSKWDLTEAEFLQICREVAANFPLTE